MNRFGVTLLSTLTAFMVSACQSASVSPTQAQTSPPLPTTLEAAIASDFRAPANKLRDRYRHPLETLKFFGLQPNLSVVEISPGAGWYTQILAPYLAKAGHYTAAYNHNAHGSKDLGVWLKSHPSVAETVMHSNFDPPDTIHIAPDGSADLVLTFRNVHNWMNKHGEQAAFNGFFRALKPGGILGVVEHRANPFGRSNSESGYVKEHEVIRLARRAGFRLLARSEINANPSDTKDYLKGVWTLPPTNRHDAIDNAKYLAIGESDRMTLKFVKPQ